MFTGDNSSHNTGKIWAYAEGHVQDKLLWRGKGNEGMVTLGEWAVLKISNT